MGYMGLVRKPLFSREMRVQPSSLLSARDSHLLRCGTPAERHATKRRGVAGEGGTRRERGE